MAYYCQSHSDCLPEEILGIAWTLLAGSKGNTACTSSSSQKKLGHCSWQVASTVKQASTITAAGKSSSAQYTMAETDSSHPTAGRRRRQKGPPAAAQAPLPRLELASDTENEHSDDSAGEKEAKRQRSEPTTPVSTSSRQPYEYDALMGITRVGTKEAERFEEDLDFTEYHDATEGPIRKEETEGSKLPPRPGDFKGGFGSSSVKECIELLNATTRNTPAPLDSGVGRKTTVPSQYYKERVGNTWPQTERSGKGAGPVCGFVLWRKTPRKKENGNNTEGDPPLEEHLGKGAKQDSHPLRESAARRMKEPRTIVG